MSAKIFHLFVAFGIFLSNGLGGGTDQDKAIELGAGYPYETREVEYHFGVPAKTEEASSNYLSEGNHQFCGKTMTVYGTSNRAVVFIHGGGWSGGTRSTGTVYMDLVDMGYTLVTIDLTLGNAVAQVNDAACAIQYLRDHGITWVGVVGKSSGGHVAAMMGLWGYANVAVLISAPLNFSVQCKEDLASSYFGMSCATLKESRYNPMTQMSSPYVCTFLVIQGTSDGVVYAKHAKTFVKAFEDIGGQATLKLTKGDHGGLYVDDVLDFFGRL